MVEVAIFLAVVALVLAIVVLFWIILNAAKINRLKAEVKKLDPEQISQRVDEEINKLQRATAGSDERLREIVQQETKDFNDRLKKNETEIEAQKEKLDNLRSRIKENGKKVVNGIFNVLEEIFGPILKKKPEAEEVIGEELSDKEDQETKSGDKDVLDSTQQ